LPHFYLRNSRSRICGACVNGTIEDFTAPADEEFPICISIANITWENFVEAFGDDLEGGNVSVVLRLVALRAAAAYLSEHNAQWPPPDFTLKVNAYSALTQEEIGKRNGFNVDEDAVAGIPSFFNASEGRNLQDLPESVDWTEMGAGEFHSKWQGDLSIPHPRSPFETCSYTNSLISVFHQSQVSRTRDSVDAAGLYQSLVPWKDLQPLLQTLLIFRIFHGSSSPRAMRTNKAAMEATS
jgi:hypothetical protein